jgi:hypothetical protein
MPSGRLPLLFRARTRSKDSADLDCNACHQPGNMGYPNTRRHRTRTGQLEATAAPARPEISGRRASVGSELGSELVLRLV